MGNLYRHIHTFDEFEDINGNDSMANYCRSRVGLELKRLIDEFGEDTAIEILLSTIDDVHLKLNSEEQIVQDDTDLDEEDSKRQG